MNADQSVNYDAISEYGKILLLQGVKNVYINGTTGEGMSLSVEERQKCAEKWIKTGMDVVMTHVGANSIADVKALASHSEKIGCHAIASLPPIFYKPENLDGLVEYFSEISSAAPNTPLLYYHFVAKSGIDFDVIELLEKMKKRVPTFTGIKFTDNNLGQVAVAIDKFGDEMVVGYGKDEQLSAAYMFGVQHSVGSTYSYSGLMWNSMIAAVRRGDLAHANKCQRMQNKMLAAIFSRGFNDGVHKRLLKYVWGFNLGPVRRPISEPSDQHWAEIKKQLDAMNYREFAKAKF